MAQDGADNQHMTYRLQLVMVVVAGWMNRQQQDVIAYLQEENRILRSRLTGKTLRLTDRERRRLGVPVHLVRDRSEFMGSALHFTPTRLAENPHGTGSCAILTRREV